MAAEEATAREPERRDLPAEEKGSSHAVSAVWNLLLGADSLAVRAQDTGRMHACSQMMPQRDLAPCVPAK